MTRYILFCLLSLIAQSALALDISDTGTYAVVHKDGHITNFIFFVSSRNGVWNIEQKDQSGSWKNVTCHRDCQLRISTPQHFQRFFPAQVLEKIEPSCIHNSAFAFCGYSIKNRPDNKKYVLIALVTGQPTPVHIKKIATGRLDQMS